LKICSVYGGVSINPQIEDLQYANVVVGTPGRILDHLERGTIDLRNLKILVLDEADRMLDMGFIEDVQTIIEQCNNFRQTLLFSATMPIEIRRISKKYMQDPIEVFAEANVDPSKLKQIYYDVEDNEKLSLLVHLLKNDSSKLVMVFCNTQRNTDFVARNLQENEIRALAIHGGHSQNKRDYTMDKFHSKDFQVLVCTDVAARGLDIKDVTHVYNYDTPNEPNQYVHRIGRTARAGAEGKAVNIISQRDYDNFARVKREHPEIERQEIPEFERARIGFKHVSRDREGRGRRFGGGGRMHENRRFGERRSRNNRRGNSRFSRNNRRGRRFERRHRRF
jgi:ATP-dependent RNA helicase DeaD